MIILAYDFETTGLDPNTAEVIQSFYAVIKVSEDGADGEVIEEGGHLWKPDQPIEPGATEVHGYTNEAVANQPNWKELADVFHAVAIKHSPTALFGYNIASYDNQILYRVAPAFKSLKTIDVYTAVQRLRWGGQIQKGKLGLVYTELTGKAADNAHDAAADVVMTFDIVAPIMKLLGLRTFNEFADYLDKPYVDLDMLMPYGKHKGTPIKDIPRPYLRWVLNNQQSHNADVVASIKAALLKGVLRG